MNFESVKGEGAAPIFGCMRVLVAIKDGRLQKNILDILSGEPVIETINYSRISKAVDALPERPFVIIIDIGSKDSCKAELLNLLKTGEPAIRVLLIGKARDRSHFLNWLRAGATAAMLESEIELCLVSVLLQVQMIAPVHSTIITRQLLLILGKANADQLSADDHGLTPREQEILSFMVSGLTYKMIGSKLNISPETVRGHVKNIYRKLMVNSQSQAVAKAILLQLV